MTSTFPALYPSYKAKTRMLIPFVLEPQLGRIAALGAQLVGVQVGGQRDVLRA